jgi:hypothetical protein
MKRPPTISESPFARPKTTPPQTTTTSTSTAAATTASVVPPDPLTVTASLEDISIDFDVSADEDSLADSKDASKASFSHGSLPGWAMTQRPDTAGEAATGARPTKGKWDARIRQSGYTLFSSKDGAQAKIKPVEAHATIDELLRPGSDATEGKTAPATTNTAATARESASEVDTSGILADTATGEERESAAATPVETSPARKAEPETVVAQPSIPDAAEVGVASTTEAKMKLKTSGELASDLEDDDEVRVESAPATPRVSGVRQTPASTPKVSMCVCVSVCVLFLRWREYFK